MFPSSRLSNPFSSNLSKNILTPFLLVNISQVYLAIFDIASSRSSLSGSYSIFIDGRSNTSAPRFFNLLLKVPLDSTGLVTIIVVPNSGLLENQS